MKFGHLQEKIFTLNGLNLSIGKVHLEGLFLKEEVSLESKSPYKMGEGMLSLYLFCLRS